MPFAISSDRLKIIQTVTQSLTRSDWFDYSLINVTACTQLVLVLSGRGIVSVDELHAKCVDTARELFSKPAIRL